MAALSAFALVALFLSALGLSSMLAFYVVRRVHEIGVRVAIGATGRRVVGMILYRGLVLVAGGPVLGLGGAVFLTRFLQEQLYDVQARDPVTFGAVSVGLLLVAGAAVTRALGLLDRRVLKHAPGAGRRGLRHDRRVAAPQRPSPIRDRRPH